MSLHRLIFDATAPAESANVGAYVRASDGTLITHTTNGGVQALDVQIANASVVVSATDLDIRDLVFATDKVDVSGSAVTVSATNLDIRDLTAASDSVQAWAFDGVGNAIASHSIGGSRYLNAASALFDGAGTALTSTLVSGKQALDVNIANATSLDDALATTAITAEAEAVATTEAALIATPLANRKYVFAYNNGNKIVYIGATGVTTAAGFPLFPGSILEMRLGAAVAPHAISQSGTQDVRVLQLS